MGTAVARFLPARAPVGALRITEQFRRSLPHRFLGFPTNVDPPDAAATWLAAPTDIGPGDHRTTATTFEQILLERLSRSETPGKPVETTTISHHP